MSRDSGLLQALKDTLRILIHHRWKCLCFFVAVLTMIGAYTASSQRSYRSEHIRFNRTEGSQAFFEKQTEQLKNSLIEKESELETLRHSKGLVTLEERRRIVELSTGTLEQQIREAESSLAATKADVEQRRTLLSSLDKVVVTGSLTGDKDAIEGMRQQLYSLENRQQELLTKVTDKHPDVIAIGEQVKALKQILADEDNRTLAKITTGPSRAYEETHIGLLNQQPLVESLQARLASLREQLAAARDEVRQLNGATRKITSLERELGLLTSSYQRHYEKLEQARTDEELQSEKMSNISIFQPATMEPRAIRPNIFLNLSAAIILGLLGSVGLAFCADHLAGMSSSGQRILVPSASAQSVLEVPLSRRTAEPPNTLVSEH